MTMRIYIERLVLDPQALTPRQVPRFQAALTEALRRLQTVPPEVGPPPHDGVTRLAERTAQAIHQQVVRR